MFGTIMLWLLFAWAVYTTAVCVMAVAKLLILGQDDGWDIAATVCGFLAIFAWVFVAMAQREWAVYTFWPGAVIVTLGTAFCVAGVLQPEDKHLYDDLDGPWASCDESEEC